MTNRASSICDNSEVQSAAVSPQTPDNCMALKCTPGPILGRYEASELSVIGASSVALERAPDVVLEEAHRAAAALKRVLDGKLKKVFFNNEQYLEFEDWQTVARFYGVTVIVRSVEYVEFGKNRGFRAVADALLVSRNQVISSADAMCLDDEANWGARPIYEWRKDEATGRAKRFKVGEEPVPLFQLRSMAQTRACAKALRNAFAWVVVLAGYRPTPAEEMAEVSAARLERGTKEAQEAVVEEKLAGKKLGVPPKPESIGGASKIPGPNPRAIPSSQTTAGGGATISGLLSDISSPRVSKKGKGNEYITFKVGGRTVYCFDSVLLPEIGKRKDEMVEAVVEYSGPDNKYANLVELRSPPAPQGLEPSGPLGDDLAPW